MRKKTEDDEREVPEQEPDAEQSSAELTRLRDENTQLADQLRRAMADLQNFRKRQLKEFEDIRKRTLEGLAAELLPVLDNFHLALEAHESQHRDEADIHTMIEGLKMVQTLLHAALERHGVSEIPAAGLPFDPTRHEAVGVEPRKDIDAGHVADVLQRGYQIGDKVVRPSRVVVSGPVDDARTSGSPAGDVTEGDATEGDDPEESRE